MNDPFPANTATKTPSAFQMAGQLLGIAPFHGGSRPPSNIWFLRPIQVSLPPSGISIGSDVFADPPCDQTELVGGLGFNKVFNKIRIVSHL